MNNNIVLECRQQDSKTKVFNNGDYEVKLAKIVKLDSGDLLKLRGVYIDTVSSNENNIQLKDDVVLEIGAGLYYYDWAPVANADFIRTNNLGPVPNAQMHYLAANLKEIAVTDVDFTFTWSHSQSSGGFNAVFTYLDVAGNKQEITVKVPVFNGDAEKKVDIRTFNVLAQPGTFIIKSPSIKTMDKTHNTKYLGYDVGAPGATNKYGPKIYRQSFVIPQGNYEPQELAETITRLFSQNGINPSSYGDDSPFLKVSKNIQDLYGTTQTTLYVSDGRKDIIYANKQKLEIKTDTLYWIGSNQLALEFDQTTNKFVWSYLHFPVYDDDGNISVGLDKNNNDDLFYFNKISGVYFTEFSSSYVTSTESIDILNVMGFDSTTFLCNVSPAWITVGTHQEKYLETKLIDARNTTSQFVGLDALIQKNKDFPYADLAQKLATSDDTNQITANNQFNEGESDHGYFLLEIDANFKTEVVGQSNITRNIKGIISKYYSYKSFSTAGEEADITYQHIGESITLSSIRIRVLDPDGTLSNEIGNKNTVFLEIQKMNPDLYQPQTNK